LALLQRHDLLDLPGTQPALAHQAFANGFGGDGRRFGRHDVAPCREGWVLLLKWPRKRVFECWIRSSRHLTRRLRNSRITVSARPIKVPTISAASKFRRGLGREGVLGSSARLRTVR